MVNMGAKQRIEDANKKTLNIMLKGEPVLIDIKPAIEVVPGMTKNTVLYAGPPIEWDRMCIPQKNGVIGGIIYEGLASDPKEAAKMVENGEVKIASNNAHRTVAGMIGIVTASIPVWVVKNETYGNHGYCPPQPYTTRALHWGNYDEEAISQQRWVKEVLAPVMKEAIKNMGGLKVNPLVAKAIQMSDDCHTRHAAATALFVEAIAPHLVETDLDKKKVIQCYEYLAQYENFFLTINMAAAKATVDPAKNIEHSTIVTCMSRNGVDFGIQVSSLGDEWFTGTAGKIDGLYFLGHSAKEAAPDVGDSAIMEVVGLGGFIASQCPVVCQIVGGTVKGAMEIGKNMTKIAAGKNPHYPLPALDFKPASIGIDIRKVVKTKITPVLNTAIVNKDKGGFIGHGQSKAPLVCFKKALERVSKSASCA